MLYIIYICCLVSSNYGNTSVCLCRSLAKESPHLSSTIRTVGMDDYTIRAAATATAHRLSATTTTTTTAQQRSEMKEQIIIIKKKRSILPWSFVSAICFNNNYMIEVTSSADGKTEWNEMNEWIVKIVMPFRSIYSHHAFGDFFFFLGSIWNWQSTNVWIIVSNNLTTCS